MFHQPNIKCGDVNVHAYVSAPVPAPRKKRREKPEQEVEQKPEHEPDEERSLSVKERIARLQEQQQPEVEGSTETLNGDHKKQRPKSQASQIFEEKGIIIGMVS